MQCVLRVIWESDPHLEFHVPQLDEVEHCIIEICVTIILLIGQVVPMTLQWISAGAMPRRFLLLDQMLDGIVVVLAAVTRAMVAGQSGRFYQKVP